MWLNLFGHPVLFYVFTILGILKVGSAGQTLMPLPLIRARVDTDSSEAKTETAKFPRPRLRPVIISTLASRPPKFETMTGKNDVIIGVFDFLKKFWGSNLLISWFYDCINSVMGKISSIEAITSSKHLLTPFYVDFY